MWSKITARHGAMKETVKEVRKLKKKTPPSAETRRCKADRLVNMKMKNGNALIEIQYEDTTPRQVNEQVYQDFMNQMVQRLLEPYYNPCSSANRSKWERILLKVKK